MSRTSKNTAYKLKADIMSSSTKGNSANEEGAIIYESDTDSLSFRGANAWKEVFSNTSMFSGFIDYNDTTGDVALTADTWTDVPNNGQGDFSNFLYKPEGVTNLLDTSTGYLDFSELTLGSEIIVRNDFTVTPQTNNALLEIRYVLGQGDGEYSLRFWFERLDNGSGIPYQKVVSFPIYMGDENTRGGVGKLQVKLSTDGTLNNAGSYISARIR